LLPKNSQRIEVPDELVFKDGLDLNPEAMQHQHGDGLSQDVIVFPSKHSAS
jgi:hypothetical protein